MSEADSRTSHSFQWSMVIVAVLPVVYLLACGPLMAWTHDKSLPQGWPEWVYLICKPIAWLRTNTPLEGLLGSYYDWWVKP